MKTIADKYCNTLQHTATHCNTLQHTAASCNTLQHSATHCNTLTATQECWLETERTRTQIYMLRTRSFLEYNATHWTHCNTLNTLQHTTSYCNTGRLIWERDHRNKDLPHIWKRLRIRCKTLQHTATRCNELPKLQQHTAAHCNTLQPAATHCNKGRLIGEKDDKKPDLSATDQEKIGDMLQHTATHCNTLQHTATHCYTGRLIGEKDDKKPDLNATYQKKIGDINTELRQKFPKCKEITEDGMLHSHCSTATQWNTLQYTALHFYWVVARDQRRVAHEMNISIYS